MQQLILYFLYQNNPVIFPNSSISIISAAGTFGSPGISIISPAIAIINPAPAAILTSFIVTVNPVGLPKRFALSERDFCVFETQIGRLLYPFFSITARVFLAAAENTTPSPP